MKQFCLTVVLTITISLFDGIGTTTRAGDAVTPVLRGLKEVSVHVEDLDFRFERAGLTVDHLRTDAEFKLTQAGIKVQSKKESTRLESPQLHIVIKVLRTSSGDYAAHLRLELREAVGLVRHPGMEVFASTWTTGKFGVTQSLSEVRKQEQTMLDTFIKEYQAANPN